MPLPFVDFTVYPDECDAYGHLNQASFLSLFERARWDIVARGPGPNPFTTEGVWPAVRQTTIEYHAQALPGEQLRFRQRVSAMGRTSFTVQQTAHNAGTDALVATAQVVFVCVDRSGRPVAVPDSFRRQVTEAPDLKQISLNGVSLGVESRGEGPALLFLHGYPLAGYLWRHQVDHLDGWRRINPDLRGMGQSSAGAGPGRLEQYSDDMIALLDQSGVERAVICGLSLGGYIAFDLVRRYRPRIAGLVLASTRAEADTGPGRQSRDDAIRLVQRAGARGIAETMVPRLFASDAPGRIPTIVAEVRDRIANTGVAGIVQALESMRDRTASQPLLASLGEIPTMVVAGASDQYIPEPNMRTLASAIPGAVYRVIEGAGHLAPLEQSESMTAAIAGFLADIVR
ncbi:MAG: alpha/beta fold hydrolase [Gemmatimonadota bacterium]